MLVNLYQVNRVNNMELAIDRLCPDTIATVESFVSNNDPQGDVFSDIRCILSHSNRNNLNKHTRYHHMTLASPNLTLLAPKTYPFNIKMSGTGKEICHKHIQPKINAVNNASTKK